MSAVMPAAITPAECRGESDASTYVITRALQIAQRTALGVLGSRTAAEDVAQDVALLALERVNTLRDPAALDAWLHRISVRAAIRQARRESRRRDAEHRAASREPHRDAGAIDDPAVAAAALLAGATVRQRAALTLRYVHDLDDHAIARALGCRTGTVRSLLSRGLALVRDTATPSSDWTDRHA